MSESNTDVIIITKGEKVVFDIFLEKKSGFPRPIDLTNYDKFKVCLEKQDGTFLVLTEVANVNSSIVEKISPDVLGQLKVTIFPTDSALLKEEFGQDIDIEWDNAATPAPKRKKLAKGINIEASNCDG